MLFDESNWACGDATEVIGARETHGWPTISGKGSGAGVLCTTTGAEPGTGVGACICGIIICGIIG